MNTKTKQLACALAGAPLPKPWWKTVEVDYYFDWLSWGIVVEVANLRRRSGVLGGRRGFMVQVGPCGVAFRWQRFSESEAAVGQEAMMAGGVDMRAAGFKAPPQHMTPMQAALSARTRTLPPCKLNKP